MNEYKMCISSLNLNRSKNYLSMLLYIWYFNKRDRENKSWYLFLNGGSDIYSITIEL